MDNKTRVVNRPRSTSESGFHEFMVFQPSLNMLEAAMNYRLMHGSFAKCLTNYLKFSLGYKPVAIVRARTYDEVFALMNDDDRPPEELGIQRLSKDMRTASVGDVFSPERGEYKYVTSFGFRDVPKVR